MKKFFGFAVLAVAIAAMAKMMAGKKAAWSGLSESQVRDKLDSRLPSRIPAEKRQDVTDQIVAKMRDQGMIDEADSAESADPASHEAAATTSGNGSSGGDDVGHESGEGAEAQEQSS